MDGGEKAACCADPHNVMMSQVACLTTYDGTPLLPGQVLPVNVGPPVLRPYVGRGNSPQSTGYNYLHEESQLPSSLVPSRSTTGAALELRRPPSLVDFNSVILVLHKLSGLDRSFLSERRLLCTVTFGTSQVRTSLISAPTGDSDELILGFIIRLPLPQQLDQPLIISVQDSMSHSIVAEGLLDPAKFPLRTEIAISDTQLHPRGLLKYHLQLISQPTGSASVQRMQSLPSSNEQPQIHPQSSLRLPSVRQVLTSEETPVNRPVYYGATEFTPPPSALESGVTTSSRPIMPHYRVENYSDMSRPSPIPQYQYTPNSARLSRAMGEPTYSEVSTPPRYLHHPFTSYVNSPMENYNWDRRSHHRAASEGVGVGGRRVLTQRNTMMTRPQAPISMTYLKREDGTLQAMPHLRTSPLGVSVIERMGQPQRNSVGSYTGGVRRSVLPSPKTMVRSTLGETAINKTESIQINDIPLQLLEAPPVPEGAIDRTRFLNQLVLDQMEETNVVVLHPFRSLSLRLDSLDAILGSGGICVVTVVEDSSEDREVARLSADSDADMTHPVPTLLIPVNLEGRNVSICVSLTLGSEAGMVIFPLQGLLRNGLVDLVGSVEMAGGLLKHRLLFSLKFLSLPLPGPALMRPTSRYSLSILGQNPPQGSEPMPPAPLALRSARSESIMSNEDASSVTDGKNPTWNHLCVTVQSIDDSTNPIPPEVDGVSTKDLYCKVSLGTTTALRARFVNWRQEGKKLPNFEFEHRGERVLKLSLVGTDTNSKLNLGVCRIDLHALSRTGRSYFRGRVPLAGNATFPCAPHLNLVFRFSHKEQYEKCVPQDPKSATSWRQALEGCTHFQFTVHRITSKDLSMLGSSFCVRLSCGIFRHKTSRLELQENNVNEFEGPVTLEAEVTSDLLDTLELKPFVVCIYVKLDGHSASGSHVAYQFFRLSPGHFSVPSEPPRTYTAEQEMSIAQDTSSSEPRCTMKYTMSAVAKRS